MKRHVIIKKSIIPGIFTIINIFFGFLAIIMAAQGQFYIAAWLILAAALFDGLDGKLARFFNVPSRFGVEFDSLADLVSFCAAPAVIIYFAFVSELHPVLAATISFVPLIFGGFRLAHFNIIATENPLPFFIGLPTPASALVIVTFVLFNLKLYGTPGDPRIALPLVFFLSFLMVSRIRYGKTPNFKKKSMNKLFILYVIGGIVGFVIWGSGSLFPMAMLYVLWGIMNWIIHHEIYEFELEIRSANGDNSV